jgi:hypothetical protein
VQIQHNAKKPPELSPHNNNAARARGEFCVRAAAEEEAAAVVAAADVVVAAAVASGGVMAVAERWCGGGAGGEVVVMAAAVAAAAEQKAPVGLDTKTHVPQHGAPRRGEGCEGGNPPPRTRHAQR